MNKEEALQRFVKDNLKFLTSGDFDKKKLKLLLKEYFVLKHNKKYGLHNNSSVCEALVRYQIKFNVAKETIVEQINIFPIFSYIPENKKSELIAIVGGDYESGLSDEELNRIDKMSSIEAATFMQKEKIADEIRVETKILETKKKKIEKEIKDKEEESLSFNSVLDEVEIEEPEFDPHVENIKQWWERFYLTKDPFPGNKDGLSRVEESLYEAVVSKTKPYIDVLTKLKLNPDYLFHTSHMLVGDFGFGKTTFQDYLTYYLAENKILPIRITCLRSHSDSNGYHDHFVINLKSKLLKYCSGNIRLEIDSFPPEEAIVELSQTICEDYKGIVIFLDDYHKFIKHYDAVFDFLGNLQPLKDELTRNNCNVGFIVSGVPKWERELGSNNQMSGFFDSPIIQMPKATVDFIMDIFNRRIKSYCYDSEPRSISSAFVEKIYDSTKGLSSYRDYINMIIQELQGNNFSIVNTPIEINEETLRKIKTKFYSDTIIGSSLTKLLKESKFKKFNLEQIHKCLELIVVIYTKDYVAEGDVVFIDNQYYFNRLKECGLIQKRKNKEYTNGFVWVVSSRLLKISNSIRTEHSFSIPDYFLKIFSHSVDNELEFMSGANESDSISRFKSIFSAHSSRLEKSAVDNIKEAMALYDRFETDVANEKKTTSAVACMKHAFENLTNALLLIDNSAGFFSENNIYTLREKFELHPIGNGLLNDMLDKLTLYEGDRDSTNYSLALTTAKGAFEYFVDYLKISITDQVNSSGFEQFCYRHNIIRQNEKDIDVYEVIKADMFTAVRESHFNYILQITNHLEDVFRSFLYITTSLCFGKNSYSKYIGDVGAVKYAHKNTTGSNVSSFHNLFTGFTRPQYRNIFTQGGYVRDLIIKQLDLVWTKEHWDSFFDIFISENIATSHRKKAEYSSASRDKYITYCNLSQNILGALNKLLSEIITNHVFINIETDEDISGTVFKVGFTRNAKVGEQEYVNQELAKVLRKNDKLESHKINNDIYLKVSNIILDKLSSQEYFIENILDIEYIQNHYGCSIHDFVFCLAYLSKVKKSITISPWLGSGIIVSRKK